MCNVYRSQPQSDPWFCVTSVEGPWLPPKLLLPSHSVKSALFQESLKNPSLSCALFPPQPLQEEKVIRGIFNSPDPQFYGASYVSPQIDFLFCTQWATVWLKVFYTRISLGFLMNELKFMNNRVSFEANIFCQFSADTLSHSFAEYCLMKSEILLLTLTDAIRKKRMDKLNGYDGCRKKNCKGLSILFNPVNEFELRNKKKLQLSNITAFIEHVSKY